jgi:hypothetical protein
VKPLDGLVPIDEPAPSDAYGCIHHAKFGLWRERDGRYRLCRFCRGEKESTGSLPTERILRAKDADPGGRLTSTQRADDDRPIRRRKPLPLVHHSRSCRPNTRACRARRTSRIVFPLLTLHDMHAARRFAKSKGGTTISQLDDVIHRVRPALTARQTDLTLVAVTNKHAFSDRAPHRRPINRGVSHKTLEKPASDCPQNRRSRNRTAATRYRPTAT